MTKYERHIKQLCKILKLNVLYVREVKDMASCVYDRKIWIPKQIRTVRTYVTALHEISHVINEWPHRNSTLFKDMWNTGRNKNVNFTSRHCLKNEIKAWRTTTILAKWWNKTGEKRAVSALLTYILSYNCCHKKPFLVGNKILDGVLDYLMDDPIVVREIADLTYRSKEEWA